MSIYVFGIQNTDGLYRFRGILDQLRPHEWRDVKDRYGPKTFQCDLIANLSLEIVALIAKYLSLADLLLLQRVCMADQPTFFLSLPTSLIILGLETMAPVACFACSLPCRSPCGRQPTRLNRRLP